MGGENRSDGECKFARGVAHKQLPVIGLNLPPSVTRIGQWRGKLRVARCERLTITLRPCDDALAVAFAPQFSAQASPAYVLRSFARRGIDTAEEPEREPVQISLGCLTLQRRNHKIVTGTRIEDELRRHAGAARCLRKAEHQQ